MTHHVDVEWTDELSFNGHAEEHTIRMHSSVHHHADGFSPKRMLLLALAGCTGMDVASLLPKMHVPFSSLVVKVDGTLSEDHPRIYTHLKVTYEVGTEETYRPQIEKAVELSVTKYCSVSAMLAKASEITHEIVIIQP